MSRLAIIGSGISGLGCAHFLHRHFDVTVYERCAYAGGHTHTVSVREPVTGQKRPVDTGFMVFNRVTYPELCRLFRVLQVPVKPTTMSFSVRDDTSGLEWCGSSLSHLFSQRRNLFNPRFLRLLYQVDRFNREAIQALADPEWLPCSLGHYVQRRGYGEDFLRHYLIPMAGAVWSASSDGITAFPAVTVLRFFHNHGFLGLHTQHPWYTVDGGAREYRDRLVAPWSDRLRLDCAAARIERPRPGVVTVTTQDGRTESYDRVILATHADQARLLLADPTPAEQRLLAAFHYQANRVTLHTDTSVMPRARRAWSAWNVQLTNDAGLDRSATHYWMNALQGVSEHENYFVSVNRPQSIDPKKVLRQFVYTHPLFTHASWEAQPLLPALNEAAAGTTETYFAGSYFGYGFHEDAFASAVRLATQLRGEDPWEQSSHPAELVA